MITEFCLQKVHLACSNIDIIYLFNTLLTEMRRCKTGAFGGLQYLLWAKPPYHNPARKKGKRPFSMLKVAVRLNGFCKRLNFCQEWTLSRCFRHHTYLNYLWTTVKTALFLNRQNWKTLNFRRKKLMKTSTASNFQTSLFVIKIKKHFWKVWFVKI